MEQRATRLADRETKLDTIQSLCETGFQVIIYGGHDDPEVREAADFTGGSAVVILDREAEVHPDRRKVALMASGAEEDEAFARFVSRFIAENMAGIYELRVINGHHPDAVQALLGSQSTERTTGTDSRRKPV